MYDGLKIFLQDCGCDLTDFRDGVEGSFHPIRSVDDKRSKRSKSYCIFNNPDGTVVVIVNDFKTGEKITRVLNKGDHKKIDYARIDKQRDLNRKTHYHEKKQYKRTIKEEFFSFENGGEGRTNNYLNKKKIKSVQYVRWDNKNNFYIPLIDINGHLSTYQKITNSGQKILAKGGIKKGAFFPMGDIRQASTIILAEGYATAFSLYESLKHLNIAVIMCCDANNLIDVMCEVNNKYPRKNYIIGADNDKSDVGLEKAQKCLDINPNSGIFMPKKINNQSTDWNDVFVLKGADKVKKDFQINFMK